jgi:hypothetical protein
MSRDTVNKTRYTYGASGGSVPVVVVMKVVAVMKVVVVWW